MENEESGLKKNERSTMGLIERLKFVVENKIMASEKLLKKSKSIEKLINF